MLEAASVLFFCLSLLSFERIHFIVMEDGIIAQMCCHPPLFFGHCEGGESVDLEVAAPEED